MACHTPPLKEQRNKGKCYYPSSVPSHPHFMNGIGLRIAIGNGISPCFFTFFQRLAITRSPLISLEKILLLSCDNKLKDRVYLSMGLAWNASDSSEQKGQWRPDLRAMLVCIIHGHRQYVGVTWSREQICDFWLKLCGSSDNMHDFIQIQEDCLSPGQCIIASPNLPGISTLYSYPSSWLHDQLIGECIFNISNSAYYSIACQLTRQSVLTELEDIMGWSWGAKRESWAESREQRL